jgi:capsular exopolysaccharide synthesis family protein
LQIKRLPSAERKLITIQRNYRFSENLYNFLTQKRAEAGITKASASSDILVINPAMQQGGVISPNTKRNYLVAFILGIGVPFLLFFLIEYFNNKVQAKEDIEGIVNIPISGLIGHNNSDNNLIVKSNPKSAVAESFRTLRSNLHFFANKQDKKVFMVTSSISGEGKSFTCMNLGAVMALSGKKTVIIGGDMRKPKMYDDFGLKNEFGLSSILSGKMSLKDVLQKTVIENLYLISAGPVPPNPSEMLMQDDMADLIKELQVKFDNIIIDTPPIALVTDAFVISPLVDHTIYITRQGFTPLFAIKNVAELYKHEKIKNISVVLNDIKNNRPGYGYGYGYGYGGYYE